MKPDIKQRIEQIRQGEVPEGYKKTKVGIIPEEWEEKILSHLLTFKNGINGEKEKFGSGIKLISVREILSEKPITYDSIGGCADVSKKQLEEYSVSYGDILFQRSSENYEDAGSSNVYLDKEKEAVFSGFVIRGKKKANYDPIFLNSFLRLPYMRNEISRKAAGAQHVNIGQDALSSILCIFPPLPEQQKIADILTTQDKVIELKEQLLAQKQQQKKYLMQQLLTGKKRLPGFNGEWDIKPLKKIVEKQKSKNNDFKYQLVLSNSAQHGIISQEQEFDKEIANEERIDGYYIVIPEAFVYNPRISVTAPCGPINMNETGETGIISPLYTVFTISSSEISQNFLKYYFKSSCWHKYVKGVANYGARHDRISISDGDFFEMPIFLPVDKEEQTAIANVLSTADREIDLLRQSIEAEKQKKKPLMQLLLTGIVRVTV